MADFYRYLAEIAHDELREISIQNAANAYDIAEELVVEILSPMDPLILHLAINKSIFYFEIKEFPHYALSISRSAFETAWDSIRTSKSSERTGTARTLFNHSMAVLSKNIRIYETEAKRRKSDPIELESTQGEIITDRLFRRGLIAHN